MPGGWAGAPRGMMPGGMAVDPQLVLRESPWLDNVPYLGPAHSHVSGNQQGLGRIVAVLAERYPSDFCWASDFDPLFVADLMRHGFLPMAHEVGGGGGGAVEGPTAADSPPSRSPPSR